MKELDVNDDLNVEAIVNNLSDIEVIAMLHYIILDASAHGLEIFPDYDMTPRNLLRQIIIVYANWLIANDISPII